MKTTKSKLCTPMPRFSEITRMTLPMEVSLTIPTAKIIEATHAKIMLLLVVFIITPKLLVVQCIESYSCCLFIIVYDNCEICKRRTNFAYFFHRDTDIGIFIDEKYRYRFHANQQ